MKTSLVLASILLAITPVFAEDHRYCFLETCEPRNHTLCQFPKPGRARACRKHARSGISLLELLEITRMYNRQRPEVKLYEQREDSQQTIHQLRPSTSDYSMQWDAELADIAERWADQCINELDKCRNVDRFLVRQRVGQAKTTKREPEPTVNSIVSAWFEEDQMIKLDNLDFKDRNFHEVADMVSNYHSRMMLQSANLMGCGAVRSSDKHFQYLHLACNFGPA